MKAGLIVAGCVLALPFTLGGCKGDAKKDAGAGKAQGEVLPGSASDAMLPLDTVKSQAPLAPKSEGGEGNDKDAKKAKTGAKASDAPQDGAADEAADASPSASASSTDN
ncbi:MAG: hypothetical protein ACKOOL_05785 [Novosphingobium sp.]